MELIDYTANIIELHQNHMKSWSPYIETLLSVLVANIYWLVGAVNDG